MLKTQEIVKGLNASSRIIFEANKEKGFWDHERNVGELLMLVTSELGEAMEAHRKGRICCLDYETETQSKEIFEEEIKDTFEDEIADSIIRLLDMCGGLGINIEKHINLKLAYNKTREKLHGKLY